MRAVSPLAGKPILIVDDEILVAMHLGSLFEEAGAKAFPATSCEQAFAILEQHPLAGAVLDWALDFEHTDPICEWLVIRTIPFIMYTGHARLSPICERGAIISKTASAEGVVVLMRDLLGAPIGDAVKH